jgi:hypothetical protein
MTGLGRRVAGLLLCGGLSACAAEPPGPAPTKWDGRWVGHFESSIGLLGCPTRGVLDAQIEKGVMAGGGSSGPILIAIRGTVTPAGEVVDGIFVRDGLAAAVMAGTFTGTTSAGRWQGTTCEGSWTMQRFTPQR